MEEQLITAVKNGNINEVRRLMMAGADPSASDNEAILWAARSGNVEIVKLLLQDPRVDPSARDNLQIRWAAPRGHMEVIRLLLEDPRVDPAVRNSSPIRWAVAEDHVEVVRLLAAIPGTLISAVDHYLGRGQGLRSIHDLASMTGCLSDSDEDLLVWAAAIGSLNLVKYLIENEGINPTFADNSAIAAASKYGQTEVMEYLSTLPGV